MKRVALLVGVNHYEDPQINSLRFAEDDAITLHAFLYGAGYEVKLLRSPESHGTTWALPGVRSRALPGTTWGHGTTWGTTWGRALPGGTTCGTTWGTTWRTTWGQVLIKH